MLNSHVVCHKSHLYKWRYQNKFIKQQSQLKFKRMEIITFILAIDLVFAIIVAILLRTSCESSAHDDVSLEHIFHSFKQIK